MDYGFHGPTMSWPVSSSLMIEPTESEDKDELDRFIASMKQIKEEIIFIQENQNILSVSNILINSPHSQEILYEDWGYPYTKEEAFFPLEFIKKRKFNLPVSRINDAYGDRNLIIKDDE
jgi:glycine dehydrogenase